jgi:hypothetical protein
MDSKYIWKDRSQSWLSNNKKDDGQVLSVKNPQAVSSINVGVNMTLSMSVQKKMDNWLFTSSRGFQVYYEHIKILLENNEFFINQLKYFIWFLSLKHYPIKKKCNYQEFRKSIDKYVFFSYKNQSISFRCIYFVAFFFYFVQNQKLDYATRA